MSQYIALFQAAVVFGTVILFGALGEILTQKSGSLNLGVPGVMYLGGIAGLATAFFYERSCAAAGTTPVPALCLLLSVSLVGTMGAFAGSGRTAALSVYGAILLHEDVGGYVLVGVVSFTAAVLLTVLCVRYSRKRKESNESKEEEKT